MSVKLANGEKIIRSYDYGKATNTNLTNQAQSGKNLTVTNKRIIHTTSGGGMGKEHIVTSEIPVSAAKSVNVSYKKKKYPVLLFFGIIFLIIGVILFLLSEGHWSSWLSILSGIVLIITFFVKKDYVFRCVIGTQGIVSPCMSFGSASYSSWTSRHFRKAELVESELTIKVSVKINGDVAHLMATELGAVILDAANGATMPNNP